MAGLTAADFTGNGVPFQCLLLPRKGPHNGLPSNSAITQADYTRLSVKQSLRGKTSKTPSTRPASHILLSRMLVQSSK